MNHAPSTLIVLKALANDKRLQILQWILSPTDHFPLQRDGDLIEDGVCVGFIAQKTGLKQPTITSHMKILNDAGLVTSKQIKNWVFYKPDGDAIAKALSKISNDLAPNSGL